MAYTSPIQGGLARGGGTDHLCGVLLQGVEVSEMPISRLPIGRGQTDKKITSTLVIQTFISFELADNFFKYGSRLFFKKAKKNSDFHPHRQRRRKHDPLDHVIDPPNMPQ